MATSAALNTSNTRVKYTISIKQNSQSVSGNYSNVTVSVRFYRTNTGYTTYGTGTVYCKINGTTYTSDVTPSQKITSSGIVLFSKTLNINHNSDGTKRLTCSAWIKHNAPLTSSEQSYSQTLTTIPRATKHTISPSTVDLGKSIAISLPRASSSFTHKLTWTFGSKSGTISTSATTSSSFTPSLSLAGEIPNSVSGYGKIVCQTYNGSTLVGSHSLTFYVKVPTNIIPSISKVSITEAVSNVSTKFGAFVQDKSRLKITVTSAGVYGSTITSYKVVVSGKTYSTSSFTTDVLEASGTIEIATTVTDSRGRIRTVKNSINVLPYESPKITKLKGVRCDSSGNVNEQGTYLKVDFGFLISELSGKNNRNYKIEYENETSEWKLLTSGSLYSYDGTYFHNVSILNPDKTYPIRLSVSDYFTTVIYTVEVSTTFALMDFHSSGRGIAFGKAAEKSNCVEFALPMPSDLGQLISSPVILQANQDLDTLLIPGYYLIGSVTVSKTIINKPDLSPTATAIILVMYGGDGKQRFQRFIQCDKDDQYIWQRCYYTEIWGAWQMVSGGTKNITFTPVSGVTVTRLSASRHGDIVTMYALLKMNKDVDAGYGQLFGHIPVEHAPLNSVATCGIQGAIGTAVCWVRNTGMIYVRPCSAYKAGTVIEFNLSWNVTAKWT